MALASLIALTVSLGLAGCAAPKPAVLGSAEQTTATSPPAEIRSGTDPDATAAVSDSVAAESTLKLDEAPGSPTTPPAEPVPTAWPLVAGMVVPRSPSESAAGGASTASSGLPSAALPLTTTTPVTDTHPLAVSPTAIDVPRLEAAGLPGEPPPAQAMIHGVTHVYQKWNNCGPSTVLMAMSAFGLQRDQLEVAGHLKPDREDTNVSPDELAGYAKSQGLEARVRYGGDRDIVRRLVAAGIPVIAEQWIDVEHRGEMGHYRVVIGYDDARAEFTAQDSYYGPRRTFGYDDFDAMWQPFNAVYVAVYPAGNAASVPAAIGPDWSDDVMWRHVRERAEAQVASKPDRAWSWYALGEVKAQQGEAAGAVEAFDRAIQIGLPFRAFWYQFGYDKALYALGAYDRLLEHTATTIDSMKGENLEESHYWRGMALRALGREDEARQSFERAVFFNPLYRPAAEALAGR